jgi:hypothetical protein
MSQSSEPVIPSEANIQKVERPSDTERRTLAGDCKAFLKVQIPESNIVSVNAFAKFQPLFNKKAMERMSDREQKKLYTAYQSTFSLQHPIKIYGGYVSDPEDFSGEVIYVPGTRQYHEVVHTIPAMFRQLKTLNELGSNVAAGLINSFLNTAKAQDNPIAQAEFEKYGYVIGQLITAINPPDKGSEEEFARAEKVLVDGGEEGTKNSQKDSDAIPQDMFDF